MLDLNLFCNKAYRNPNFMVTLYINSEKYMQAMSSVPNFVKSFFDIKKIGYNINVIRQTACMVVNFASLFNCTPAS